MFRKLKLFFFSLIFYTICFSQKSNTSDIDFLIERAKNTYAGYQDKVKSKTFNELIEEVKKSNSKDTFELLSKLTSFFSDLHFVLYDYNIGKKIDTNNCNTQKVTVEKYLKNKKIKKREYEGYWLSEYNNCVMAMKQVSYSPIVYYGYVIETKTKINPGFVILKLTKQKNEYFNTDYIEEALGYRIFLKSKFKDSKTLLINSYGKWRKINKYKSGILSNKTEFSYKPLLKIIDNKNILLKLPDFGSYNVKYTDSLIKANLSSLSITSNLIIDIRNNMGGTIRNYLPLLKFIYTRPIIHCGVNQLYSEDFIEDYKADLKSYETSGDTAMIKIYKNGLDSIIQQKGKYQYTPPDTIANYLTTLNFPKNVALVINNNCLSAAELMILDFKQSEKVKIFGETSGGALDYLDALIMDLPSKKYKLFVATSKRESSLKNEKYDGLGIRPDIEISDNITDWIDYITKYYESK